MGTPTTPRSFWVLVREKNVISNIKGALNWRFLLGYTYGFALVEIELHSPSSRPVEHFINILLKVSYVLDSHEVTLEESLYSRCSYC